MLNKVKHLVFSVFKGNERSVKARKNIFASLFIKGGSIVIGFLIIPITLNYLDETRYGIWITLSSFLTWFSFFEVGLGSGLKNKLSEALANKDYLRARIYISTTYAILALIVGVIGLLFFIFNTFIDWTRVLNTNIAMADELSKLALVVFSFFCFRFVIKLIGDILQADQRPAVNNLFGPVGNLIALIIIYILTKTTHGSLLYVGFVFSCAPVLVLIVANIYFFTHDYRHIAPSIKEVKFHYVRELLGLGVKFFVIQVSALVMFQSSNFIIIQFFGPTDVTAFNIAYKYFSIIQMIFTIVVVPYWAAFNEAWVKKDLAWIRKTIGNLIKMWYGFVAAGVIMYLCSELFFNLWIGRNNMSSLEISQSLRIFLIIYFLLFSFGGIFNMFINGVGKLSVQLYSLLLGAVMFVPLCYLFIHVLGWGVEGVVLSTIISNFYSIFVAPVQYYKIINNTAHGIWNR